jgi:hypothetical protein
MVGATGTIQNLVVNDSATITNNLMVGATGTIQNLVVNDSATIANNLMVGATGTIQDLHINNFLEVEGTIIANNIQINTITFTDGTQFDNLTIVNKATINELEVTSTSQLDSLVIGNTGDVIFTPDLSSDSYSINDDNVSLKCIGGAIINKSLVVRENIFSNNSYATNSYNFSDIRLKENIINLEKSLEKVLLLRGVKFDWKNKEILEDKKNIGFIAQEVEEIIPELVSENLNGFKQVNYIQMIALLVEAIKEQNIIIQNINQNINQHILSQS